MLLETIRCVEGNPLHLSYHQKRLDTSLRCLGIHKRYDLDALIHPPKNGIFRCRFLYSAEHFSVEFLPYAAKTITSLKLIEANDLEYPLKYSNRDALNRLYEQRGESDDVLIVKNGYLTDTTIANIALFIEGEWLTPQSPLLGGTARARLIEEGVLIPAPLTPSDISKATKIALMNAMVSMIEVENGIIH